jgi:hypothetical protein
MADEHGLVHHVTAAVGDAAAIGVHTAAAAVASADAAATAAAEGAAGTAAAASKAFGGTPGTSGGVVTHGYRAGGGRAITRRRVSEDRARQHKGSSPELPGRAPTALARRAYPATRTPARHGALTRWRRRPGAPRRRATRRRRATPS